MPTTIFTLQSDQSGQTIALPTSVTSSFVESTEVDIRNFSEVDWIISFSNAASITRIDLQWEWTDDLIVTQSTKWTPLSTETVSVGVSTVSTYEIQYSINGLAVPFSRGFTTPAIGRYMRILIKAGVGSPTSSSILLKYLRRI